MRRQGRYDAEFGDARHWMRFVEAVRCTPEVVPFGALVEGRLAAYAITLREGGWVHILTQMSRTDLLAQYPNHALTFQLVQLSSHDPEIESVSFGLSSLIVMSGLHSYKLEFGFKFEARNSVIQFHPALRPLLANVAARHAAQALHRAAPRNQRLEYVAAILQAAGVRCGGPPGGGSADARSESTSREIP
jgi:hypothetical protein